MPKENELYQVIRLIAFQIGKLQPFMRDTACMSPEYREIIGYIFAYHDMTGDNSLDCFIKPIQDIGRSVWGRTELSDLGFLYGDPKLTEKDAKDLRKTLAEIIGKDENEQ